MTDLEYDIIDELYFVTGYQDLKETTELTDEELIVGLSGLVDKGFIRVFSEMDVEVEPQKVRIDQKLTDYLYLASKKGLKEHNLR